MRDFALRHVPLVVRLAPLLALFPSSLSASETREQYLARLTEVCAVDCMVPRDFRRAARTRDSDDETDMAIIMDVAQIVRVGSIFELRSMDLETTHFDDIIALGSAGIDTTQGGVGGLSRGRDGGTHPNLIIIELDEQTVLDLFRGYFPTAEISDAQSPDANSTADGIVVEGDRERELESPSLVDVMQMFRNRRIVVRGQPRLQAVVIGARRDYRRKQVTLVVKDADDLVMLPRYDEEGNPILEGEHANLRGASSSE